MSEKEGGWAYNLMDLVARAERKKEMFVKDKSPFKEVEHQN